MSVLSPVVVGREKTDVAADYGAVFSIARSVVNIQKQADRGVCGPA